MTALPIKVRVEGPSSSRAYLLSWRHGHLLQQDKLRKLLEGRLEKQQQRSEPHTQQNQHSVVV